jgi:hypothetical protein
MPFLHSWMNGGEFVSFQQIKHKMQVTVTWLLNHAQFSFGFNSSTCTNRLAELI